MIYRGFATVVLIAGAIVAASASAQPFSVQPSPGARTARVQPVPPQAINRYARLQPRLQPIARAWFEQQAWAGRGRTMLNLPALETAIRARFGVAVGSPGVDYGVFVTLMMMADASSKDLQDLATQLAQLQDAKKKIGSLISDAKKEHAGASGARPEMPCRSPFCQSLPGRAGEASSAAASAGHPIRLDASGPLTYGRLSQIEAELGGASSELSDFGETEQLRLQTLMDERSKLLETLSNIFKKIENTDDSIVQSLK